VHTVEIQVQDPTLKSAFTVKEEAYEAHINENNTILKADHYVGFVHALETFLQAIECPRYKTKNCELKHLPLIIKDQPDFTYRGIMVDTSRHFLPIHLLYETVDAMMYNKMSVFHWHITDEDAFPLIL
jgi:hexosaminidase